MIPKEASFVPRLIAKAAIEAEPLQIAGLELALDDPGALTLIAPFPGQDQALAAALEPLGLHFPAPGKISARNEARLVWSGRGQALLMGAAAPEGLQNTAAVTDQTDAWATFTLTGSRASDALSRLVGLDLRIASFPIGHSARSALNHMPLLLIREETPDGADRFLILTFRSMARTAWAELSETLHHLAARDRLPG